MARGSDKLERLLNLTALLLETTRPLTAAEIQKRLAGYPESHESFRRAFERDKDDLRQMGIPLHMEEVPGVDTPVLGYRIPKDKYYLRDPGLEPDELAALHLAASQVRLEGVEGERGLWKLGGHVRDESVASPAPGEVAALPANPNLVPLFEAVSERRPATFVHRGIQRTLDPHRLDFIQGHWYVTGYDHLRRDRRSFRIDRIEGEVTLGRSKAFARPSGPVGVRLRQWELGEGQARSARVLIDGDQAAAADVVGHVGEAAVTEQRPDGSIVLNLEVTSISQFRSFVLGFLDHAEVLDPPELRDDIVEWLEAIVGAAPKDSGR